jgi:multisubunit Na+/H+ antiporter MnhB subunit
MTLAFDLLLIVALLWLAWRALAASDLFKGVVLFIAFGLLLALAWVRLQAPDIALAEAAIGSGLTGALLLATLGRLQRMDRANGKGDALVAAEVRAGWVLRGAASAGVIALTLLLGWVVLGLPQESPGLAGAVQAQLGASGVSNPVTAVLLNFRAYDTLLEVGVLLVAVVAVWALAPANAAPVAELPADAVAPQQTALVNLLLPVMVVTAGYLLWAGASAPGGAFQAGAVLGGAGTLLILSRPAWAAAPEPGWLRSGLVLGPGIFLMVGLGLLVAGRRLLEYPDGWAGTLILVIEAAAAISIGLTLTLLFLGGRPAPRRKSEPQAPSAHPAH